VIPVFPAFIFLAVRKGKSIKDVKKGRERRGGEVKVEKNKTTDNNRHVKLDQNQ
jgi:hypothetical protein